MVDPSRRILAAIHQRLLILPPGLIDSTQADQSVPFALDASDLSPDLQGSFVALGCLGGPAVPLESTLIRLRHQIEI
jgi:hypothetical protein